MHHRPNFGRPQTTSVFDRSTAKSGRMRSQDLSHKTHGCPNALLMKTCLHNLSARSQGRWRTHTPDIGRTTNIHNILRTEALTSIGGGGRQNQAPYSVAAARCNEAIVNSGTHACSHQHATFACLRRLLQRSLRCRPASCEGVNLPIAERHARPKWWRVGCHASKASVAPCARFDPQHFRRPTFRLSVLRRATKERCHLRSFGRMYGSLILASLRRHACLCTVASSSANASPLSKLNAAYDSGPAVNRPLLLGQTLSLLKTSMDGRWKTTSASAMLHNALLRSHWECAHSRTLQLPPPRTSHPATSLAPRSCAPPPGAREKRTPRHHLAWAPCKPRTCRRWPWPVRMAEALRKGRSGARVALTTHEVPRPFK